MCSYDKNSINEIWKSNFYKDLRNQHLKCKFSNEFCKQCPDWKNTSWPFDKNKSYADLVKEFYMRKDKKDFYHRSLRLCWTSLV